MKRIILMLVMSFGLSALAITAIAQPPHAKAYGKRKYYYYPSSNVYYDPGSSVYLYNNSGTWATVNVLPPSIVITTGSPRVIVYHDGPDVWYDNPTHVVKYKNYKVKHKKGKWRKN